MVINKEIKAQKDFLTWLSKGKELYIINNLLYGNEYFARSIENLYIDKKFFKETNVTIKRTEKVLQIEECEPLKIGRATIKLKKLRSDNYTCYVDSKYLDYFNDDYCLKISGEFSLIEVYENDYFTGIIYPFIMKK